MLSIFFLGCWKTTWRNLTFPRTITEVLYIIVFSKKRKKFKKVGTNSWKGFFQMIEKISIFIYFRFSAPLRFAHNPPPDV